MATRESALSAKCVKNKPANHFAERIENSCGNGTADLVLSANNVDTWIELKCCDRPKNDTTPIDCSHIRKGQVQWHRRKRKAGNDTWCLIQVGSGHHAIYYLFESSMLPYLKEGRLEAWYKQISYGFGKDLKTMLLLATQRNYFKARQ